MPPKSGSKSSSKGKGGGSGSAPRKEEAAEEEPLQAIIVADSYDDRFAPLTTDVPRCLLPLINAPLIDWTLEALSLAGVQSVYVLARSHTAAIRSHVEQQAPVLGMSISVIPTPEARSIGDVMRELDAKQVIKADFILVHGDCVGNMDIAAVVEAHKERRKKDKDAIMTICTMPVARSSRTRPAGELAFHFLAPSSSQLLHYENVDAFPRVRRARLPLEVLVADEKDGGSSEVDIRSDLVEAGIDICSVDVPPLFSENFDYQDLRRDFVTGILTSDLLESKIFVHIAPSSSTASQETGAASHGWGYAARVRDTRSYDAISRDVLARWTYPFTPGANCPGSDRYSVRAGLKYFGQGVQLSRTCTLGPSTLLGPQSQLGDNSAVSRSVIGTSATIGNDTSIRGSYVWKGAKIGARCTVDKSIIGENVTLLDEVKLGKGCIIANGCVVGPNVTLPPFTRVGYRSLAQAGRLQDGEDSDEEDSAADRDLARKHRTTLGQQAIGYLWPYLHENKAGVDSDDSDDDDDEDHRNGFIRQLGTTLQDVKVEEESVDDLSSVSGDSEVDEEDEDEDDEDGMAAAAAAAGALAQAEGSFSDPTGEGGLSSRRLDDFKDEARASLKRAFEENHTIDNAAIELKTLRMASNVPLKEVRRTVINFVLERCPPAEPRTVEATLERWGKLISTVSGELSDQVESLNFVQYYCARNPAYARIFVGLLTMIYNEDIFEDEAFGYWWKGAGSKDTSEANGGPVVLDLRKSAEARVRQIVAAAEDDDDDEDDDDEDDDE